MPKKLYDILAVGNAIIDVFSQCSDDFLLQNAIEKGGMNLVDAGISIASCSHFGRLRLHN